jgi:hypothetical protein
MTQSIFKSITPGMNLLDFLIGKWNTSGEIMASEGNAASQFTGTDSYEWILDGHYILHQVDVIMNNEKVEAFEIIGDYDPGTKRYKLRSFDNQGTFTAMEGFLDEKGTFHILGDKMCARLSVIDKNTMSAHWENSKDNQKWVPWMDLTLSK